MSSHTDPRTAGATASTRRGRRRTAVARRWELRACGRHGHATYAPTDRPDLADRLRVPTPWGEAWRCLRCGAYVPGAPRSAGPADAAPTPARGTALRDAFIIRLLAIDRLLRALVLFALAYGVWAFNGAQDALRRLFSRYLPQAQEVADRLDIDLTATTVVRFARRALNAEHSTLLLIVAGIAVYGLIELVEAIGLWSMRRWGEYVAVVATSVFLPYEIYDLIEAVTPLRLAAFVINVAAVLWLVWTKRLFGVRGGAAAFEKERQSASILEVERAAL